MVYRGVFERAIHYNKKDCYTVAIYKSKDVGIPDDARKSTLYQDGKIRFSAVGYNLPRSAQTEVVLQGEWMEGQYGLQLRVFKWDESVPLTLAGIKGYLCSGLLKGIGASTAEAIVARFGLDSLMVLENQPERYLEINGITENRLDEIREAYHQSIAIRDLVAFLAPYNITPTTAQRIYSEFGIKSIQIVRKSPYELCRISGFGFRRVDEIAQKTGWSTDDPMRMRGALFCVLREARKDDGHLFLPRDELVRRALAMLNANLLSDEQTSEEALSDVLYETVCSKDLVSLKDSVYLEKDFLAEASAAKRVARILATPGSAIKITQSLDNILSKLGITLAPLQRKAIEMVFQYNLSIITGAPGTGKTMVLKIVLEVFRRLNPTGKIELAAPTGRASQRMAESTGFQDAKTLHNLLGLTAGDDEQEADKKRDVLDADLVVVDETSMADMWLSNQLFSRLKQGARILLVGDPDQLPSVGPGCFLRELIECGLVPVTTLNQIFRQSNGSLITRNAAAINHNHGKLDFGKEFQFSACETTKQAAELIHRIYMGEVRNYGVEHVQILSPFKKEGAASTKELNLVIRESVNPASSDRPELIYGTQIYRCHDRVIQTKNRDDVYNGDIGTIVEVLAGDEPEIVVAFTSDRTVRYGVEELEQLELAYALTVHKAMGSEFKCVIMPMLIAHKIMLDRNIVYTAITRAKESIFLVGQYSALTMAINRSSLQRNTHLGALVRAYYQKLTGSLEKRPA